MTCAQLREIGAELALGVADGHERADALAHLDQCADCRREVRGLGEVVEALTEMAPPAEPPAGFESRVLARLTTRTKPPLSSPSRPRRPPTWVAAAAAAAVVLAVAGFFVGRAVTGPGAPARAPVLSAVLVAGRRDVGQVVLSGGGGGWISVAVHTGAATRRVRCELLERNGYVVTVGTFTLEGGEGYWAAPVPRAWSGFSAARLVGPNGVVLASASLSGGTHG